MYGGGSLGGEVWAWNGAAWVMRSPAMAPFPPTLDGYGLAFDPSRGVLVAFGGFDVARDSNRTFEWNGSMWNEITPAFATPPARRDPMMCYLDFGRVLLYGGTVAGAPLDDAWIWDGFDWRQVTNGPSKRASGAMVFDGYNRWAVVFGGVDDTGTLLNDTWVFDGVNWGPYAPATTPPAQQGHQMAYDTSRDRVVLHGGYRTGPMVDTNETWEPDAEPGVPTEAFLSDYLGGPTRGAVHVSTPPFTQIVSPASWGIGVDRPGSCPGSQIKFSEAGPFAKGVGAHPVSEVVFDLDAIRKASGLPVGTFETVVGIDEPSGGATANGAIFEVLLDGASAASIPIAGTMAGSVALGLDVSAVQLLTLRTVTLGATNGNHACWADARLAKSSIRTCGTAKVDSLGCSPTMHASGYPSASSGSGLIVSCDQVRDNKAGLSFYNVTGGQNAVPFQCGTLWLETPLRRTSSQFAGGAPKPANDCSGSYVLDFDCFAVGGRGGNPDPALSVAGTEVHVQAWGRDQGFAPPATRCSRTPSSTS